MAQSDGIVDEAKSLITGTPGQRLQTLAEAFIAKRLSNSTDLESAKKKALDLLIKKLEDNGEEEMSTGKLVALIEMLGEQTGGDLKVIMDAQAAAMSGKNGGSSRPGGFFGGETVAPSVDGPAPRREQYKLLDKLNQVAEAVIHNRAQSQGASE